MHRKHFRHTVTRCHARNKTKIRLFKFACQLSCRRLKATTKTITAVGNGYIRSSACSPKTRCTALQGRCLPCSPGLSNTRTLVLAHICIVASHSSWCLLPTFVPMFSDSQKLRPFWHNSHISLVYHPVNRAKKQLRHPILHRIVVDIGAVNNGNNL